MSEPTITHVDGDTKGQFEARVEGTDEPAVLTYSKAGATMWIVDHTAVPDALQGKGLGRALAQHVVEQARARGLKLMPLCPFFKAQLVKHPEWRDVV